MFTVNIVRDQRPACSVSVGDLNPGTVFSGTLKINSCAYTGTFLRTYNSIMVLRSTQAVSSHSFDITTHGSAQCENYHEHKDVELIVRD